MNDRFDEIVYLKEALKAYTVDLELRVGYDKAQQVLDRVINDFGFWQEHVASTEGSDKERETWSDLKNLKLFWNAYEIDPELSVSRLYNSEIQEIPWLDKTESEMPSQKEKELNDLYKLCLSWVTRTRIPYLNMDEFLAEFNATASHYITRDQFKKALQQAGQLGIIKKGSNNRWIPG